MQHNQNSISSLSRKKITGKSKNEAKIYENHKENL